LAATPRPTLEPAESYLRVSSKTGEYDLIPLNKPGKFNLIQGDQSNIIEIGVNSVKMHSSSCENQDCVKQGEMTLENRDSRILYDMIICLPNQVMLQLLSAEEARALEG
ncbi:MAG: NusG domain II-containing protein, partial [Clostridia bacterium]